MGTAAGACASSLSEQQQRRTTSAKSSRHVGNAQELLPSLDAEPGQIDFVFVGADKAG
jgi:hypothetical protein